MTIMPTHVDCQGSLALLPAFGSTCRRTSVRRPAHRLAELRLLELRAFCGTRVAAAPLQRGRRCRGAYARQVSVKALMDVDEANFEAEVLQADRPVLVDFWATWCGPCKLIAPLLYALEKDYGDALKIVKVEADPCPNLVEKYKVYGLPTIILFREGSMVVGSHKEGAIGKAALLKYLDQHNVVPAAAK